MTRRSSHRWNVVCLLLFPVLLFVLLWLNCRRATDHRAIVSDTTRVVLVDTVTVRAPVVVDSVVVRWETVRLPVMRPVSSAMVAASSVDGASVTVDSVVGMDSATVEIPITQKEYGDSTWRAWVSGYGVQLDSIRVYPRREVVTVTQTMTRRVSKRWGVGLQAGYSWQRSSGWHPYIGLGIQYNLLSF